LRGSEENHIDGFFNPLNYQLDLEDRIVPTILPADAFSTAAAASPPAVPQQLAAATSLAASTLNQYTHLIETLIIPSASARRCGFHVMGVTTIRLWHAGTYRNDWEDSGRDVERFDDYTFQISDAAPSVQASFSEKAQRE
jgi:hypothetical protein